MSRITLLLLQAGVAIAFVAAWYVLTPMALRVPVISGTLIAVRRTS